MKFNLLLIFLFIYGCANTNYNSSKKKTFETSGFAYLYNEIDYANKIVSKKFSNNESVISHNNLRVGTFLKITNPDNKRNVVLKISKKAKYPNFYKILITEKIANELKLNTNFPFVIVEEIKKNKSFIAKKSKMYNEERKVSNTAPVSKIKIDNISKNKKNKRKNSKKKVYIILANFYSAESAKNLRDRIISELPELDKSKLKINEIKQNNIELSLGPYLSINAVKNINNKLYNIGFEDPEFKILNE